MLMTSSIGLKDGQLLMALCILAWTYKISGRHATDESFLYNKSISYITNQ